MRILITGPALADPANRIATERLADFIGCHLEADGQAVDVLRAEYPHLPASSDGRYAVAIGDALEALALKPDADPGAVIVWGQLIDQPLVYFPTSSVEIETT